MSGLKYYKPSGKIDFKSYLLGFILAIIASYFIGELYLYFNNKFQLFIIESVLKSDLESHTNQLAAIVFKVLDRPRGFIILLVILGVLIIPLLITLLVMGFMMDYLRKKGKSRNKIIDFVSCIILTSICFFVSNEYTIITTIDCIVFFMFCLTAWFSSLGIPHYFCEKCFKSYKEKNFYLISKLDSDVFLENVINNGLNVEITYEEEQILEKDDIENLYYVELNECDTCHSKIVKIESKRRKWENGKKKIEYGKTITEHLIINKLYNYEHKN
jgi:hypothetical protein